MTTKEFSRASASPCEDDARKLHAPVTAAPVTAHVADSYAAAPAGLSGLACREFEASLVKLQAVTEQMQHTEDADGLDSLAFARALENYQRAKLVWLSNEIMLRGSAICMPARVPAPERVLSLHCAEPVAASYEILLRINGYPVVSLDEPGGLDALLDRFVPQAVLLDLDERFGMKLACIVRAREWQRQQDGWRDMRIVGLASPRLAQTHVPLVDIMIGKPAQLGELVDAIRAH
jgi:hypothetical protein